MRTRTTALLASVGVIFGGSAVLMGCGSAAEDCKRNGECISGASGTGGSGAGGGTGGVGNGGGGEGGAIDPGCVPSDAGKPVEDSCGVFVSSSLGDDGNAGTKDKPFKTIGAAIAAAKGHLYVCAEGFDEAVKLPAGGAMFGGLDCTNGWAWVGETKKTALTAAADAIPLTLAAGGGTSRVEDFAVTAKDAAADGGSSIAVVVDGVTAEITRCDLVAGAGKKGANGANAPGAPAASGDPGGPGNQCANGAVVGGTGTVNNCGDATLDSQGGKGGDGAIAAASSGVVGFPNLGGGQPGTGDDGSGGWSCALDSGEGKTGAPGGNGDVGSAGTSLGTLSATGISGADGGDGGPGVPGQGGGGGGGRSGMMTCGGGMSGASGGGGGAGGCGGLGGGGGKAGGSSIALVSAGATLKFGDVKLTALSGADGGTGGDYQSGGNGGGGAAGGGSGANAGCKGGDGGPGGNGAPGGGGRGGHSIGLAFTGTAPDISQDAITIASAGGAGKGGNSGVGMNDGSAGTAAKIQAF